MQSLKEKALKGTAWSAIQMGGMRLVNFAVFWILARQLNAENFGLISYANVYIALVTVFVDQGFTEAIIQRDKVEKEHLDTVFWIGVVLSTLMVLISVLFAPNIANLFNESELTIVIQLLSINFILISLSSVPQAILKRNLEFKGLAVRSFVAAVAGGIVGVVMAFQGYGVWSLVGQTLVNQAVGILVLWRVVDWRPGIAVSRQHFKELFTFGINIVGSKVINFFNRRADDLLIGYFLGTTMLGYYTIAYKTLLMLTQILIQVTQAVALPAFSRLQDNPKKLISAFKDATSLTALVSFPIFFGISLTAPTLIPLVYGEQWANSIPIVQVLMFVGALHSILFFHGSLSIALGATSWRFGITTAGALLNLLGFFIALRWGLIAIAFSYAIMSYLLIPVELWLTKKLLPSFDVPEYLKQYLVPIIAVVLMALAVWGSQQTPSIQSANNYLQMTVLGCVGAMAYFVTIYTTKPELINKFVGSIKSFLPTS